jgi:hypothetical protein
MARFIHIDYPAQHGGVTRVSRGLETIGSFSASHALLHFLAVVGSPVTAAAGRVRTGLAVWREERKQREEDRKLWNLALTDARIMADLSRAMSQDAMRGGNRYF